MLKLDMTIFCRKIYIFLVLMSPSLFSLPGEHTQLFDNPRACQAYLEALIEKRVADYLNVPKELRDILAFILPVGGRRVLETTSGFRNISAPQAIVLENYATDDPLIVPRVLRIELVDQTQANPWIELDLDKNQKTLKVPRGFDLSVLERKGKDLILQFFMGHPLHPYLESKIASEERLQLGEPEVLLKTDQLSAATVVSRVAERCDQSDNAELRKILVVARTGFGKTLMLLDGMRKRLAATSTNKKKLQLVVADTNALVNQLSEDLRRLSPDIDFRIVKWGGEEASQEMEKFIDEVQKLEKPTVLVTTRQSLIARMRERHKNSSTPIVFDEKRVKQMRMALGSIFYDEAHHAGAEQASGLIRELVDAEDSRIFLYGTSATPLHAKTDILELFGDQSFWVYLDNAEKWLSEGGKFERDIGDIILQLKAAIKSGELTPFHQTFFLNVEDFGGAQNLFKSDGSRYVIRPEYYTAILQQLKNRIQDHEKGFIAVNTIEEANAILPLFKQMFPGRNFAVLHSEIGDDKDKIITRTRLPKSEPQHVDYVITVRMLDEGVNIPGLSLYIDLNTSIGPRQFLQRVGRVLRIFTRKEGIDIVTFMPKDETTLRENLRMINAILDGDLKAEHETKVKNIDDDVEHNEDYEKNLDRIRDLAVKLEKKAFWSENNRERIRQTAVLLMFWFDNRRFGADLPTLTKRERRDQIASMITQQRLPLNPDLVMAAESNLFKQLVDTLHPAGDEERELFFELLKEKPALSIVIREAIKSGALFPDQDSKLDTPDMSVFKKWRGLVQDGEVVLPSYKINASLRASIIKRLENLSPEFIKLINNDPAFQSWYENWRNKEIGLDQEMRMLFQLWQKHVGDGDITMPPHLLGQLIEEKLRQRQSVFMSLVDQNELYKTWVKSWRKENEDPDADRDFAAFNRWKALVKDGDVALPSAKIERFLRPMIKKRLKENNENFLELLRSDLKFKDWYDDWCENGSRENYENERLFSLWKKHIGDGAITMPPHLIGKLIEERLNIGDESFLEILRQDTAFRNFLRSKVNSKTTQD